MMPPHMPLCDQTVTHFTGHLRRSCRCVPDTEGAPHPHTDGSGENNVQLSAEAQRRRQDIVRASDWHSWGIWLADHTGNEVFVENEVRTLRRKSVLSQIADSRRRRRGPR